MLRISWSSLRTHGECKQKGYLHRQKKKATLTDVRNYFPGTITDRVTRDWLNSNPSENQGAMPDMVESIMDREEQKVAEGDGVLKWRDPQDRSRVRKECIEAVTKIEPVLNKLVVPFTYQPDYKFQVPLSVPHPSGENEKILLIGYMDILVHNEEKDQWFVYDVKHTKDNSYWRKTRGQLTFYDLAVGAEQGKDTNAVALLQPLCNEPVKGFRISEQTRSALLVKISEMANDVWKEDHTPRSDSSLCNFCDVKHACSKFQPTTVNGKRVVSLM